MSDFYIIVCVTDGKTYGEFDDIEKAKLRAKTQAERNPGREYAVTKLFHAYKVVPKEFELVEQEYDQA